MSQISRDEAATNSGDVISLRVDGASASVNTLRDQQTARGLSLVCPFPALEVHVPVSFRDGVDGMIRKGSIHRIGVEDDPETGLPKLRLSIRTGEHSGTTLESEVPLDPRARTDPRLELESSKQESSQSWASPAEALMGIEEPAYEGSFREVEAKEPAWADCTELPLPAELMEIGKRSTLKKLSQTAAWCAVVGLMGLGGYLLHSAGVFDLSKLRDSIAGITAQVPVDNQQWERSVTSEPVALQKEHPIAASSEGVGDFQSRDLELAGETSIGGVAEAATTAEMESVSDIETEPDIELASATAPVAAELNESESGDVANQTPAAEEEKSSDVEATLILPTRWTPEYSTAYRVRDPNGVVVDVPGGLVRREGWLEIGEEQQLIRSVKSVQREAGARFIVYVNGDLPNFITSPKAGGISLKLYYPDEKGPSTEPQVAMLD